MNRKQLVDFFITIESGEDNYLKVSKQSYKIIGKTKNNLVTIELTGDTIIRSQKVGVDRAAPYTLYEALKTVIEPVHRSTIKTEVKKAKDNRVLQLLMSRLSKRDYNKAIKKIVIYSPIEVKTAEKIRKMVPSSVRWRKLEPGEGGIRTGEYIEDEDLKRKHGQTPKGTGGMNSMPIIFNLGFCPEFEHVSHEYLKGFVPVIPSLLETYNSMGAKGLIDRYKEIYQITEETLDQFKKYYKDVDELKEDYKRMSRELIKENLGKKEYKKFKEIGKKDLDEKDDIKFLKDATDEFERSNKLWEETKREMVDRIIEMEMFNFGTLLYLKATKWGATKHTVRIINHIEEGRKKVNDLIKSGKLSSGTYKIVYNETESKVKRERLKARKEIKKRFQKWFEKNDKEFELFEEDLKQNKDTVQYLRYFKPKARAIYVKPMEEVIQKLCLLDPKTAGIPMPRPEKVVMFEKKMNISIGDYTEITNLVGVLLEVAKEELEFPHSRSMQKMQKINEVTNQIKSKLNNRITTGNILYLMRNHEMGKDGRIFKKATELLGTHH